MRPKLFLFSILTATAAFCSCAKIDQKGVVEHQRIYAPPSGTPTFYFNAFAVRAAEVPFSGQKHTTVTQNTYTTEKFIYHPDKTLKDLGYTERDTNSAENGYFGKTWETYVNPEGAGKPGVNGFWD